MSHDIFIFGMAYCHLQHALGEIRSLTVMSINSEDKIFASELTDLMHDKELSQSDILALEFRTIKLTSNAIAKEAKRFWN